jgi:hypothetical protein
LRDKAALTAATGVPRAKFRKSFFHRNVIENFKSILRSQGHSNQSVFVRDAFDESNTKSNRMLFCCAPFAGKVLWRLSGYLLRAIKKFGATAK